MAAGDLNRKAIQLGRSTFVGGRVERFEMDGRLQLIALLRRGLTPDAHVIDVGCGALRAGYWLIHFLDAGHYHGIEPTKERVEATRAALLETGLEEAKRPAFSYNDDFDLSVFGVAPDYVLARSIWSHAAKAQIQQLLDSFAGTSAPGGLLLASYHPAGRRQPGFAIPRRARAALARISRGGTSAVSLPDAANDTRGAMARRRVRHRRQITAFHRGVWNLPDYEGDTWVTGDRGQAAHRFGWIEEQCRSRGLTVRETLEDGFGTQVWLEVRRPR
jgi:SAM-dependent methyltransferase